MGANDDLLLQVLLFEVTRQSRSPAQSREAAVRKRFGLALSEYDRLLTEAIEQLSTTAPGRRRGGRTWLDKDDTSSR